MVHANGERGVQQEGEVSTVDRVAGYLNLPFALARKVLPDRELPVYLGVGALAALGLIEWPIAAAAGLGYAALRRWGPRVPAAPLARPLPAAPPSTPGVRVPAASGSSSDG